MIGWPELMQYGPLLCGGVVLLAVIALIAIIRKR